MDFDKLKDSTCDVCGQVIVVPKSYRVRKTSKGEVLNPQYCGSCEETLGLKSRPEE